MENKESFRMNRLHQNYSKSLQSNGRKLFRLQSQETLPFRGRIWNSFGSEASSFFKIYDRYVVLLTHLLFRAYGGRYTHYLHTSGIIVHLIVSNSRSCKFSCAVSLTMQTLKLHVKACNSNSIRKDQRVWILKQKIFVVVLLEQILLMPNIDSSFQ